MGFCFFLSLSLILIALHCVTRTTAQLCSITSCGELSIDFPFRLKEANQRRFCGYPGFELSCNNKSQALLSLPYSGDFVVTRISLEDQRVWINDPDGCLPRRLLANLTPESDNSPFQFGDSYNLVNYSFLNCPSNVTTSSFPLPPISCLGSSNDTNHSVYAVMTDSPFTMSWTSSCELISYAKIPVAFGSFWTDYGADIQLQWDNPNCGYCEAQGGRCGFAFGNSGPYVACYGGSTSNQAQGLSRRAKYGVALGLGIPAFLGAVMFACIFWGKMKTQDERRRRRANTEFSTSIIPHPTVVVMGLDGATIEKYPKTQLGESGRLPNPNDNVCSICLSEYQPKDELRTIPDCNHYFHATCIDGWLKMNATCPLCRKLPSPPSLAPSNNLPLPAPVDSS